MAVNKERDAIIAGLRLLASEMMAGKIAPDDGDIGDILTCGGEHNGLSSDQIDELAMAINLGDYKIERLV